MNGRPLTDEQRAAIARRLATGATYRAVAADVGLSASSVSKVAAELRAGRAPAPAADPQLDRAVERLREAAPDEDDEPQEAWRAAAREARRVIRKAVDGSRFAWRAPGKHLLLTVLSDLHIGSPATDYDAMERDARLIRSTPNCYCVLAGDQVDNHLKHRGAIINSEMAPSKQYLLFEYWLRMVGDRCLVVTSGNHDAWTVSHAGVDVLARIVQERRVFYARHEAYLDLQVGGQTYVVGVRHQYRLNSSFNQTHSPKQWLRLGEREFDVGVIGHHHEHALESTVYRGRARYVTRPGSYQVTSGYSADLGYNRSVPTCPTFLLRGDAHKVTAWDSLADVAASCAAVRELGEGE